MVIGKPLSMLLLKENATVTICHTRTKELPEICRQAEILVAAAGKAGMVEESWVSDGAVVIDVGINVDENGKLCGDVGSGIHGEPEPSPYTSAGSVGAVTTAVLAKHLIQAARSNVLQ